MNRRTIFKALAVAPVLAMVPAKTWTLLYWWRPTRQANWTLRWSHFRGPQWIAEERLGELLRFGPIRGEACELSEVALFDRTLTAAEIEGLRRA